VYKLIDCVSVESAKEGGGSSSALSACKTNSFDDSAITYTFKDIPAFFCGASVTEWMIEQLKPLGLGYEKAVLAFDSDNNAYIDQGYSLADAFQISLYSGNAHFAVVEMEDGHIFGGFTTYSRTSYTASYCSSYGGSYCGGSYQGDSYAFLFSFTDGQGRPPVKLPVCQNQYSSSCSSYAYYDNYSYGPTWGGGHDLYIGLNDKSGYSNLGHSFAAPQGESYGSSATQSFLAGKYSFNWKKLSVYRVTG
jgi:hypothetical protein